MAEPRRIQCLVAALLLAAAAPVAAHRLQVFAAADGAMIRGSAYFARGGAASGAVIRILGADGRQLAELAPDADGAFAYSAVGAEDHLVIAETPDGHRAEWHVGADELAPGLGGPATAEPETVDTAARRVTDKPAANAGIQPIAAPAVASDPAADPALTAAVERAVARQLRPLREELAEARAEAGLRDVLGGIGYIAGIAGLALWWRGRRARP